MRNDILGNAIRIFIVMNIPLYVTPSNEHLKMKTQVVCLGYHSVLLYLELTVLVDGEISWFKILQK